MLEKDRVTTPMDGKGTGNAWKFGGGLKGWG